VIEYRDAGGKLERLPALAAELVALKVDVIVASSTPAALATKQATSTLPIVFPAAGDPIASGLVTSLARPGGNLTGLSILNPGLVGKRLEQLKQAIPGGKRVAVLWHPGAYGERTDKEMLKGAEIAARALGVRLQFVEARGPADIDRAFSDIIKGRSGALLVLGGTMFNSQRKRLVDLAAKNRLPAAYPFRTYVEAGGLMAYGLDLADSYRRAATYVDKILKGAQARRPARRAADEARPGDQPQDGQGPWPDDPSVGAGAGGPCHRVMDTETVCSLGRGSNPNDRTHRRPSAAGDPGRSPHGAPTRGAPCRGIRGLPAQTEACDADVSD
jgi:ABC-type uncharacterized transport system substrate-binding protein